MNKQDLIALIDRMRAAVEADDSMEGRFTYQWADRKDGIDMFNVDTCFRIGNAGGGQGGVILVQEGEMQ